MLYSISSLMHLELIHMGKPVIVFAFLELHLVTTTFIFRPQWRGSDAEKTYTCDLQSQVRMQLDSSGRVDHQKNHKPSCVPINHQDDNFRRRNQIFQVKYGQFYKVLLVVVLFTNAVICSESRRRLMPESCSKSRKLLTENFGVISDGPPLTNYTENTHCEWLIKPPLPSKFISLEFSSMATECSYDYIFVYDGDNIQDKLIGSFSGQVGGYIINEDLKTSEGQNEGMHCRK